MLPLLGIVIVLVALGLYAVRKTQSLVPIELSTDEIRRLRVEKLSVSAGATPTSSVSSSEQNSPVARRRTVPVERPTSVTPDADIPGKIISHALKRRALIPKSIPNVSSREGNKEKTARPTSQSAGGTAPEPATAEVDLLQAVCRIFDVDDQSWLQLNVPTCTPQTLLYESETILRRIEDAAFRRRRLITYPLSCFDELAKLSYMLSEKFVAGLESLLVDRTYALLRNADGAGDLWDDDGAHDQKEFVNSLGCNRVSGLCLSAMVKRFERETDVHCLTALAENLLRCAFDLLKNVKINDDAVIRSRLAAVTRLMTWSPIFPRALGNILGREIDGGMSESATQLASEFEATALLSSILHISSLKQLSPAEASLFTMLPSYPQCRLDDIQGVTHRIANLVQTAVRTACQCLVSIGRLDKNSKENVVAWLSLAVRMSETRCGGRLMTTQERSLSVSDSWARGLVGLLMELCCPFLAKEPAAVVDVDYLLYKFQLDMTADVTLLKDHVQFRTNDVKIVNIFTKAPPPATPVTPQSLTYQTPSDLAVAFSFSTALFFLTLRSLHTCHATLVAEHNQRLQAYHQAYGNKMPDLVAKDVSLFRDSWRATMCGEEGVESLDRFVRFGMRWFRGVLSETLPPKAGRALITEVMVTALAQAVRFLGDRSMDYQTLRKVTFEEFLMFVGEVLMHISEFARPLAPATLCTTLHALLQMNDRRQRNRNELALLQPAEWGLLSSTSLSATFSTHPTTLQIVTHLPELYAQIDSSAAIDVDAEPGWSESQVRSSIAFLINKILTSVSHGSDAFKAFVSSERGANVYQEFVTRMMKELVFHFEDALLRVGNVREVESGGTAGSDGEKSQKLFLEREKHSVRGVMLLVNSHMILLNALTAQPDLLVGFVSSMPKCIRHASIFLKFLNALCGRKRNSFKIKDPEELRFDPKKLVRTTASVFLRLGGSADFRWAVGNDVDYERQGMTELVQILQRIGEFELVGPTSKLVQQIEETRPVSASSVTTARSRGPTAVGESDDELVLRYRSIMRRHQVKFVTLAVDGEYSHTCKSVIESTVDPGGAKAKRLMREVRQLQAEDALPLHPSASIFAHFSSDRSDIIRCILTGPSSTPYAYGCFVFDIYIPAPYPTVPPVVKLVTTGGGTVRFNPNLYNDGKVCLSLLGTWHGGSREEKWDATRSSIYQVLVSIQSMIMIADPLQNEPGYEDFYASESGKAKSKDYDQGIRLATLRFAVLGNLRTPPFGCHAAIRSHFRVVRSRLLQTVKEWISETPSEDRSKFESAGRDIEVELEALGDDDVEENDEENNL
ncbi:hypothetical protein HDU85_000003 [Gaertneriomyces sp. JEL0708]|nr:hypothetical protein HDU85_000003 [Gaertneriomyces sp. JEL0708]